MAYRSWLSHEHSLVPGDFRRTLILWPIWDFWPTHCEGVNVYLIIIGHRRRKSWGHWLTISSAWSQGDSVYCHSSQKLSAKNGSFKVEASWIWILAWSFPASWLWHYLLCCLNYSCVVWSSHPISSNTPAIVSDGPSNDLNSGLWIMHLFYSHPITPLLSSRKYFFLDNPS